MNTVNIIAKLNELSVKSRVLGNHSDITVIHDAIRTISEQKSQLEIIEESRDFWKKEFNELSIILKLK